MNHYERLKVSPEAPPEVIRAAYRALAAKMHPDRKVGDSGPGDKLHEDMAALNASYLVLMDSKARTEYDQWLAEEALRVKLASQSPAGESRWGLPRRRSPVVTEPSREEAPDTRVDMAWSTGSASLLPPPWFKEPKWMIALGCSFLLALGGTIWGALQQVQHLELGTLPAVVRDRLPPPPGYPPPTSEGQQDSGAASEPALSPQQMAHMSDSELLAAMPQLLEGEKSSAGQSAKTDPMSAVDAAIENAGKVAVAAPKSPALEMPTGHHLLDGQPLTLQLAPLKLPPHGRSK